MVSEKACVRFFSRFDLSDEADGKRLLDLEAIRGLPWSEKHVNELGSMLQHAWKEGLDDESLALSVINRFIVGSRFQTLARIVSNLIEVRAVHPSWSKRQRLNFAICAAVLGACNDLEDNFRKAAKLYIANSDEVRKYNQYLLSVWTAAALMQGKANFPQRSAPQDLTELGLGNLVEAKEHHEDNYYYHISEPIVLFGLRFYFLRNKGLVDGYDLDAITRAMVKLVEFHDLTPSGGTLLEDLVFHSLLREEFQDKPVADLPFVRDAIERAQAMRLADMELELSPTTTASMRPPVMAEINTRPWWEELPFQVAGYVRCDAKPPSDCVQFLMQNRHVLYAPEPAARFDGMVMLDADKAMTFGITVWGDCVPNEMIVSQTRSTNPQLAYLTAAGTENAQCREQRLAWEQNGLNETKAVRVHICLPRFSPSMLANVDTREDELLIYLDCTNIGLLLPLEEDGLRDLMAAATRTRPEEWLLFPEDDLDGSVE